MTAYVYRGKPGTGFEPGETYNLVHPPAVPGWELATTKKTEAPEAPEETP